MGLRASLHISVAFHPVGMKRETVTLHVINCYGLESFLGVVLSLHDYPFRSQAPMTYINITRKHEGQLRKYRICQSANTIEGVTRIHAGASLRRKRTQHQLTWNQWSHRSREAIPPFRVFSSINWFLFLIFQMPKRPSPALERYSWRRAVLYH